MTINREQWLQIATDHMRPWFVAAGKPLPEKIHISIGFGSKRSHIGECWAGEASADKNRQIFVHPGLKNDLALLSVLIHELCHAALPHKTKHHKPFQKLAATMGLTAPWRSTGETPELVARLNALIQEIGPSPHPALAANYLPKKQTTRMLKYECECGVIIRAAKKDLDCTCNLCNTKFVREGAEDEQEEKEE